MHLSLTKTNRVILPFIRIPTACTLARCIVLRVKTQYHFTAPDKMQMQISRHSINIFLINFTLLDKKFYVMIAVLFNFKIDGYF